MSQTPGLADVNSPFSASVPQIFADVDRDKVLNKAWQLRMSIRRCSFSRRIIFESVQPLWAAVASVPPVGRGRAASATRIIGHYYVRNNDGRMVPLRRCDGREGSLVPNTRTGFNLYRAAQVLGTSAPGYSSARRDRPRRSSEEVFPRR